MSTRDEAVERIGEILAESYDPADGMPDQPIRDILADIVHYADAHGVDVEVAFARALVTAEEEGTPT